MSRKLDRSILKKKYERFCEAWANEKRYQRYVLEQGQTLPEGVRELGRKPTFSMWLQAMKNKQIAEDGKSAAPTTPEKSVEVADTKWE